MLKWFRSDMKDNVCLAQRWVHWHQIVNFWCCVTSPAGHNLAIAILPSSCHHQFVITLSSPVCHHPIITSLSSPCHHQFVITLLSPVCHHPIITSLSSPVCHHPVITSLVSEQKEWSVERKSGHAGQWTERVATMITNFGRPHMLLARQVCVCGTSAFLWSICNFANVQMHS